MTVDDVDKYEVLILWLPFPLFFGVFHLDIVLADIVVDVSCCCWCNHQCCNVDGIYFGCMILYSRDDIINANSF